MVKRIEHQPGIKLDMPTQEVPAEYRELAESAQDVIPWLDDFFEEKHPIAEQYREARYRVERSRADAELYFAMKERRNMAIKRFKKALEALQIIAQQ